MNRHDMQILIAEYRKHIKELEEIKTGCKTCQEFDHNTASICKLCDEIVPAEVITVGCEAWIFDEVPF